MSPKWLAHPEWLAAAIALVAATALALALARLRARRRRRLLLGSAHAPRTGTSDLGLLAAFACIALAVLGPRIGERVELAPASGVDVVFVVDVSRSMDARDVPPSRLDRARRGVRELLERLDPRDRAALVAFADRGALLAPLTPDRGALLELLGALDSDLLSPAGSDLGSGVLTALEAFEAGGERPRVVFVLSDGEDPERRRALGAAEAARSEARILAVALGTEIGDTIPDHDVPLVDRQGSVVVTRRDWPRLAALAAATGGEAFRADEWGVFDFDRAAASIRRDGGSGPVETVERRVRAVRVAPLAAMAFALLLVEVLPRRRADALAIALVIGAGLTLAPDRAPGEGFEATPEALEEALRASPGDAGLLIRLGVARLERGLRDAASRAFLAAAVRARDPRTAAVAYYDLGVASLEQGDLPAARDAFFDALALDPEDDRARYNLEWTLQALALRPPPTRRPPEPEPVGADARAPQRREAPRPERVEREDAVPPRELPELTPEARRRWLERIVDDPRLAMRGAAGAPGRERAGRGPAW